MNLFKIGMFQIFRIQILVQVVDAYNNNNTPDPPLPPTQDVLSDLYIVLFRFCKHVC